MLNVQMYSTKELPRNFCLPGDPYEGEEDVLGVLQALGVLFYRDEHHSFGVIFDEVVEETGGNYCQLILDESTMEVDEWSEEMLSRASNPVDNRAWIVFNKSMKIFKIDKRSVVAIDN